MIRQGLILPEFLCKYASVPAGILAFGSEGNFLEKAASGVTKLYTGPRDAMGNYDTFRQASQDFNSLTAREFYEKHGADAGNYLLDLADRAVQFGNQVASNFQDQPIETILATVLATGGLWAFGETFKFVRQKGQGGLLTRFERKMGNKLWEKNSPEKE